MKKVLLTTVCGPFGADTDDCTRHVMPELFHAQVTRAQGIFSIRSTYIAYGLEYIAENITTPATVLQYPTMSRFKNELKKGYDYVGISFVIATFDKMKKMSRMIREVSPGARIILGGYGTMLPECDQYGDYVCREEGVDFMRRLLGEVHNNEPKRHVVCPTRGKVLGFPAMKGAVVLAGLGCPHGCEFCATSHFHKKRHIPLLKTGTDLHREIRRVHKVLGNPNLPIGIIEEDFLLQKERAAEYLECVKKDEKNPIRISCFASAYSVTLWDPEDLVRMGIETIWIGVESRQANYAKLKGLDIEAIFETLHSHGINTLASLIIGHDFHTVEKVWEDLDYLVSLNPSLSQFLILTPACSTPLFDRLRREGRLLDMPHKHWDGFHLAFAHPRIDKEKMEQLILDVYDEEYRRLGPSVIRFIEKQFRGYLRFRDAADPLLSARAGQYRQGCLDALPLFPIAARRAPTKEVARRIREIRRSIVHETGAGGLKNRILSGLVPALALAEQFKLKHCAYPQVRMGRTEYRMPGSLLHPAPLTGNGTLTIRPRMWDAVHHPLIVVDLHGVFDKVSATDLKKRIKNYLKENMGHLAINFSGVTCAERDTLFLFLKRLRSKKERIKIISIDSLRADMADVVAYARSYFEVFTDIEGLTASLA
ncbi:MAG: B12-binding domain-containing radical SAM protein [bacterium]